MVELTSTSASNGTRNWYLYWYRCISSVDVFIIGHKPLHNGGERQQLLLQPLEAAKSGLLVWHFEVSGPRAQLVV
jgi:hypothetical protein